MRKTGSYKYKHTPYPGLRMPSGQREKRGFTLIELLVVIAIIAVLASLLLPALEKARTMAELLNCKSRLRQVGIASEMYVDDYEGWYPYSGHSLYTGSAVNKLFDWEGTIGRSSYPAGNVYYRAAGYIPLDEDLWKCPDFGPVEEGSLNRQYTLAMIMSNAAIVGNCRDDQVPASWKKRRQGGRFGPYRQAEIPRPAKTVLYVDGEVQHRLFAGGDWQLQSGFRQRIFDGTFDSGDAKTFGRQWEVSESRVGSLLRYRHNRRVPGLFVDQHIEVNHAPWQTNAYAF